MEIAKTKKICTAENTCAMVPPYWQSVNTLEAILTDPKFWQYTGNNSIKSIELNLEQYKENKIIVNTDDGRTITITVKPAWVDQWMDFCDFEIEYEGEMVREEETPIPETALQLIDQLARDVKGYPILQVIRENNSWKITTLYNR